MSRQMKIVFYGLIVLVAILAASSVFFFAKSRKTSPTSSLSPKNSPSVASSTSTATPQVNISTAVTKTALSSERPSDPSDIYTIEKGDSLLVIAQQNGLTMEELTSANGISDPDKILRGQVLLIPKGNQINFTLDNTKATNLQKFVDNGKYSCRLIRGETARSDNAGAYC